jgi:hypothetical protein
MCLVVAPPTYQRRRGRVFENSACPVRPGLTGGHSAADGGASDRSAPRSAARQARSQRAKVQGFPGKTPTDKARRIAKFGTPLCNKRFELSTQYKQRGQQIVEEPGEIANVRTSNSNRKLRAARRSLVHAASSSAFWALATGAFGIARIAEATQSPRSVSTSHKVSPEGRPSSNIGAGATSVDVAH